MQVGDSLSVAVLGLNNAQSRFNKTTELISEGNLNTDVIVASQVNARDVEIQLANVKAAMEIDESALDLLA